jgi:hypothetical protein
MYLSRVPRKLDFCALGNTVDDTDVLYRLTEVITSQDKRLAVSIPKEGTARLMDDGMDYFKIIYNRLWITTWCIVRPKYTASS